MPKLKKPRKPKIVPPWLLAWCRSKLVIAPVPEYRPYDGRKIAIDYAWPDQRIGLEEDGGVYGYGPQCPACGRRRGGAHGSIKDIKRDQDKANEAAIHGWRILRVRPEQVKSGEVFALLDRVFGFV